jgi:hypothetical protein
VCRTHSGASLGLSSTLGRAPGTILAWWRTCTLHSRTPLSHTHTNTHTHTHFRFRVTHQGATKRVKVTAGRHEGRGYTSGGAQRAASHRQSPGMRISIHFMLEISLCGKVRPCCDLRRNLTLSAKCDVGGLAKTYFQWLRFHDRRVKLNPRQNAGELPPGSLSYGNIAAVTAFFVGLIRR